MNALARPRHQWQPPTPVSSIAARTVSREPALAEVLARLEVAAVLGDATAAGRLLDSLASGSGGACGMWLHRQIAAAALRAVAQSIAT